VVLPVESDQNHFDWRAGLDWQINPDVLLYTSASTGYRPPAFNPRPFQPSQFVPVRGESMTAYELGMKSDWWDRKLRVNLAAFYSDYKQRIIPAAGIECVRSATPPYPCTGPVVVPLTAYVNAPAKIKGGELELEFRPIGALLVTAQAGVTNFDASTTTFQGAPYSGTTPNGETLYVPKWNASASAQYTVTLPNGATLTPRWDAYLQTQICSGQFESSCTPGYVLHNARVEYATSNREWAIAAGIQNLTNKIYYYNVFDLTPFGEPTIEAQVAPPREWYLQVTRNFQSR